MKELKTQPAAEKNKNAYFFKVKGVPVTVTFSENPSAPTVENALVNIAIRKQG